MYNSHVVKNFWGVFGDLVSNIEAGFFKNLDFMQPEYWTLELVIAFEKNQRLRTIKFDGLQEWSRL